MQAVRVIVCLVSLFLTGCQLKPLAQDEWSTATSQQLAKEVKLFHHLKFCFKTFTNELAVVSPQHATSYSAQKFVNALYSHFKSCVWKMPRHDFISKDVIKEKANLLEKPREEESASFPGRFGKRVTPEDRNLQRSNQRFRRNGNKVPNDHLGFMPHHIRFGKRDLQF